jgi:tetratricopeptide (TPR) repeat protein
MLSWAAPLIGQVRSPAEPTDTLKYCRQLLNNGQVEAAEAKLREYRRDHPESDGAAALHALAQDAIQAFEKAALLLPRSADAAAGLGFSYGQSGQPEKAEHWFQRADDLNAKAAKPSAMVYRLHGQYLLSRELPAEALPLLSKALSLDPNSGEVQFALGMCYIRTGRLPKRKQPSGSTWKSTFSLRTGWPRLALCSCSRDAIVRRFLSCSALSHWNRLNRMCGRLSRRHTSQAGARQRLS